MPNKLRLYSEFNPLVSMNIEIRTATNDDAESVHRVLNASRIEFLPYAPSAHTVEEDRHWVSQTLIPTGRVELADLSGITVGVVATSVSGEAGWVDQLYVLPGYTNQGVGTALLTHSLSNLPRPVRLWTFQENKRAINFYTRHGFSEVTRTNGEGNEERCPDVLLELQ